MAVKMERGREGEGEGKGEGWERGGEKERILF